MAFGKFVVTPLVAIGRYRQGQRSDLGGVFQFRSSLGVSYELKNRHRLGLNLVHISNVAIHENNPGKEELYLIYAIPF